MAKQASSLRAASFFLLRTPSLPVTELLRWSDGLAGDLAADRATLRERLRAIVERDDVREAIYVASPSLALRLHKWRAEPESKDGAKAEQVLVRYFARMTSRATPFGLFAGFSVGATSDATELEIAGADHRHARLDMEYVTRLAEALEKDARDALVYAPNSALYEAAGALRYPELKITEKTRHFELTEIDPSVHVRAALARAEGGASRREIAEAVASEEVSREDALDFVDELIGLQVLSSSLAPQITGTDPLNALLEALGAGPARQALERVRGEIAALNEAPIGVAPSRYEAVAESLAPLPLRADPARLFQVDMRRDAKALLGPSEVEAIGKGALALHALAPSSEDLAPFARAFAARYGDREVPLMQALDDEIGVAGALHGSVALEPTPLLDGLRARRAKGASRQTWSARERVLLGMLEEAWTRGARTLALTDERIAEMADPSRQPMPASIAVLATVLADRRIEVHAWWGASAARLLGRFAAWDARLTEALRAHLREEEAAYPGAILAEIVHMPDASRSANVLLRPLLREYEIAFSCRSGAPPDRVLPLSDLLLSVRAERVILRSRRLGKEIVPRLSTAHNYGGPKQLAVYRLMASLQGQGATISGSWSWGALDDARFLPRVEYGPLVLAPARWLLRAPDLARICAPTSLERHRAASALRDELRLPRIVGLEDGDNVLPVDLGNSLSIDAFAGAVKDRPHARLIELFVDEKDQICRGPRGVHTHEVVVPFIVTRAPDEPAEAPTTTTAAAVRRTFGPGSEWLYAKVHCAPGSVDRVLAEGVRPIVEEAERAGLVDTWHFVRHAGAGPHVRVRLRPRAEPEAGRLLALLDRTLRPFVESGIVHRCELAPYERELETYGGARGVEIAERIFEADSRLALALIGRMVGRPEGRERWGFALVGTARLLADAGLDVAAQRRLAEEGQRALRKELGLKVEDDREIAERFRAERGYVEKLLTGGPEPLFAERSSALSAPLAELAAADLTVSRDAYLRALVRVWNHRILRAKIPLHELVLYTFLAKHCESLMARRKA
jgi:thiopeptide-type bacteriocin biosynthesis protein